jgi:hypothetical protein
MPWNRFPESSGFCVMDKSMNVSLWSSSVENCIDVKPWDMISLRSDGAPSMGLAAQYCDQN